MLTPQWVATTLEGRLLRRQSITIMGFSIDSRTITPGQFFIALPGDRVDGHQYVTEAFERGACGALVSRADATLKSHNNVVVIGDTHKALAKLGAAYRQLFQVPMIGVTGSVGKTTTKELIGHLLKNHLKTYVSPGNFNNEIGLPISLLNMPFGTQAGVFEVGAQKPGELKPLANMLGPSISVITTVTDAHRAFFESQQALVKEKWQLVDALPLAGGIVVLNADHTGLWSRATHQRFRLDFGIDNKAAAFRAEDIQEHALDGTSFILVSPAGRFPVRTALLGRHNIYNVLAAVAVATEMRVMPAAIQESIAHIGASPHRMERKSSKLGVIVDDSYNASPSAVKAAVNTLSQIESKMNKVFVFGDMGELGDKQVDYHQKVADWVQDSTIRKVFTLGELAAETARTLQKRHGWSSDNVLAANSLDELEHFIQQTLKADNNLILVKGSRAMSLDRLVDHLGAKVNVSSDVEANS